MRQQDRLALPSRLRRPEWKLWLVILLAAVIMPLSATRMGLPHLIDPLTTPTSSARTVVGALLDIKIAERRDIERIPNFDPHDLPPLAYIEQGTTQVQSVNRETLQIETREVPVSWLVEPLGYVEIVGLRIVETIEIAFWGTLLALVIGLPLALIASSTSLLPEPVRLAARTVSNLLRAIPELVSALILVALYGFGPLAGVLALALHSAGYFGKFLADAMEDADLAPQHALEAIGAPRLAIWRAAVLPQAAAQFVSSILYIMDRNVRMATVVGLVGAGGIGQELKGRLETYDYGHAGTILLAIFIVVVILDGLALRLRRQLLPSR